MYICYMVIIMWENAPSHVCRGGDLRGLSFCCPPVKGCPIYNSLSILKMTPEEFVKIKENFGKKTRLGEGKNTCFGSLVWCCKITKPCPYRDSEMLRIGMGEDEYMELKKELSKEIIKNSKFFKEAVDFFKEKGMPVEIVEDALVESGDLREAYEIIVNRQ